MAVHTHLPKSPWFTPALALLFLCRVHNDFYSHPASVLFCVAELAKSKECCVCRDGEKLCAFVSVILFS